ncbi:MAG: YihY/virulence factor BrkB family protein [Flavobacteriales bacterium]|nr:YihY/virulence factor BrkB family protein [Flavobacteriales bacterium]
MEPKKQSAFLDKILKLKLVQAPINLSKRIVLPGFDGIPLYEVLEFLITGLQKSSLTTRASSLAFRFFLALFPSLIFLLSLLPYIPIDHFYNELLLILRELLPEEAYKTAKDTMHDLFNKKHNTLLSFGFLFALYLASDGVNAMIEAFQDSYHTGKKVNFIKKRLISLLLLVILTFLMIAAIGLIVFSGVFISYLISNNILSSDISLIMLNIGKIIILLLLFFLGISSIYYFGGLGYKKFRFISAGSTLATLLTILLSFGFAFYVNNFASYNKIYGSIGTLIVIMLWLYFNSLVLLIGYELNASIKHAKSLKTQNQES